jgi:hypothetical protein
MREVLSNRFDDAPRNLRSCGVVEENGLRIVQRRKETPHKI